MLGRTQLLRRAAHATHGMLRSNSIRSFSSASRSLVITASGRDRLGVVNDLAKALEASHGNIEESRMTVLGDDFSMVTASEKSTATVARVLYVCHLQIVLATFPDAGKSSNIESTLKAAFPDFTIATRYACLLSDCSPSDLEGLLRRHTGMLLNRTLRNQRVGYTK